MAREGNEGLLEQDGPREQYGLKGSCSKPRPVRLADFTTMISNET